MNRATRSIPHTLLLALFGFITLGVNQLHAAVVIGATGISSPQGSLSSFPLARIINQSGLSGAYVSGVTDFDSFVLATTNAGLSGSGFTDTSSNGPQQFVLDLGTAQTIDAIAVWNSGSFGSITSFELLADDDGDYANGTIATILAATGLGTDSTNAQVFTFAPISTRYVVFNGLSNTLPSAYYALGEVVFRAGTLQAVPEPSSSVLLLTASALGLMVRRRSA